MFSRLKFVKKVSYKNHNSKTVLRDAVFLIEKLCNEKLDGLDIVNYKYDPTFAVDELGLDYELVMQLLDDYVAQIIKSILQFEDFLKTLHNSQEAKEELDYTPFRELAHKNLGVARNLRIKDAEILLYQLMKKDDLDYLLTCLEALKACAIRLSPDCAYNTLKLIEVKNSILNV